MSNKKRVIVRGPAMTLSGYGEQCRFALRSLRAFEDYFDIFLIAVGWGQCGWISENTEERQWIENLIRKTHFYEEECKKQNKPPMEKYDLSLQVTIPNEWEKMAPVNVGYTAGIETDRISPQWIIKSHLMDRIIVVSNHAKSGFDNTFCKAQIQETGEEVNYSNQTPVTVVNYPVREFDKVEVNLDMITTDFNFLVMAQWGPRKNIDNTIKWFVEEFEQEKVGLVLKVFGRKNSAIDRNDVFSKIRFILKDYPKRKCKVYLLHGEMTPAEINSLYSNPKINALTSIAHGEGFGLPLFEAACNGLPLICPAWGGQMDFITALVKEKSGKTKEKQLVGKVEFDLAEVHPGVVWKGVLEAGTKWCYPKGASYKSRLRDVQKNITRYKSQAKVLQKHILKEFKAEKKYKEFADATAGEVLSSVTKEDLPKVSFYTSVFNGEEVIEGFMKDMVEQTIFDKCELVLIHPKTSPGFKKENKVITDYVQKHNNIIYKVLDKDPGTYACWNIGAKLTTGEYVGNANLDDRHAKNFAEKLAKELYINKDVSLVYSDALITDKFNETFENNSSGGRKYNFPEFSFDNLKMVNMPHAAPLYRKELHKKFGYFDEKMKSASDWEFHLRCASKGTKMKKVTNLLYLYCFSPTGISTNPENFSWKREEEMEVFKKYKDISV